MIGGTFIQTLILIWFTFRTDWTKEVNSTTKVIITLTYTILTFNSFLFDN